jgi:hypothetical protein
MPAAQHRDHASVRSRTCVRWRSRRGVRAARLLLLTVLTVLTISSAAPATSHAGYYDVDNCYNGDGTGNPGSWSNAFFNDSSRFMWNNACTLGYGMRLVFTGNGGAPAWQQDGVIQLSKPAPAELHFDTFWWWTAWNKQYPETVPHTRTAQLTAQPSGTVLAGPGWGTTPSSSGWVPGGAVLPGGTIAIQLNVSCAAWCPGWFGWVMAEMSLSSTRMRMYDSAVPSIGSIGGTHGNGAFPGWWRRGNHSVSWLATDASGIRHSDLHIDNGGWTYVTASGYGCNYAILTPCSNQWASFNLPTTSYGDGGRCLLLRSWDASNVIADNIAQNACGTAVYIDNTAPSAAPVVRDGPGADQSWFTNPTTMVGNWDAASDATSGIHSYYKVMTDGAVWISAYTNIGNTTSTTTGGLALAQGGTYYNCVHPIDNSYDSAGNVGNVGAWACSNGARLDSVQPTAFTVADGSAADITYVNATNSLQANWTAATDATSGMSRYDYCVSTNAGGADCAGAATRPWTGNALATSVTAAGLPVLTNGTTYYVCVRAVDVAGNTRTACSNGQRIDRTNPSVPTFVSPPDDYGVAAWPALTATYVDPAPATPGRLQFQVCSDAACTTVAGSNYSAAGLATGSNGNWTPGLANGTYWWRVRGEDGAGNLGSWTTTRLLIVGAATASISVDSPTRSFGAQVPGGGLDLTSSTIVTVASNAANGYQLQASDSSNTWGLEQPAVATIPDWTGTVATPTVWAAGTAGYFGITVRDATGGRLAKWGPGTGWPATDFTNNRYAGLTTAAQIVHQRATYATAAETVTVTYRTNIPPGQEPGAYATSISYTLVAQP